jgi:hypothetical protein
MTLGIPRAHGRALLLGGVAVLAAGAPQAVAAPAPTRPPYVV